MATWYGAPYKLDEPFEIDTKWLVGHETESDFAKFNSEVLTIIHEEKRFPNKDELIKIRNDTVPPMMFTWDEITKETAPKCWGYIDNVNVSQEVLYEPIGFDEWDITRFNGMSWEDFVKADDVPKSALASTSGINKHTLNHRLI